MTGRSKWRRRFRAVEASAVLAGILHLTPALASEAAPDIVVTGSRIATENQSPVEAVMTIQEDVLRERGTTNIADLLNELPGIRGSVTLSTAQNNFGQGVNFVNLFNLGSNRTLTLVNGRRMVTSNVTTLFSNANPGNQVDLNAVADIMVDRVEMNAIGGAPAYGSDAVAGTINLVLKRRYRGLDLRATMGVTQEGDNFRRTLAGIGGFDFAGGRGNLTVALSSDRADGVLSNSRVWYRANVGSIGNPCSTFGAGQACTTATNPLLIANLGTTGRTPASDGRLNSDIGYNNSASDGIPGSVLVRDASVPLFSRNGVLSSGSGAFNWQFDPDGNLVPFNRGILYASTLTAASGGDGLRGNDFTQITSALKRFNAYAALEYALSDALNFRAEGIYYHGKANKLIAQPAVNVNAATGSSAALVFNLSNPFLSSQARQQLTALGYTSTFALNRFHADLADLSGEADTKVYQVSAALTGRFELGGRPFEAEAAINYGRNDFTDYRQDINQQRFANAVNVALVSGQIACSTTQSVGGTVLAPVADALCKPLNLFGEGAPSQEAIAYVVQNTVSRSRQEQLIGTLSLGGKPFDLFGNPVSFNLGYEYHRESGTFTPDDFLKAGLGRTVAIAPTSGRYSTNEVFGEVLLPLIAPENGMPIERLDLFGRARHVSSSANGGFTAWTAGGRLAPVDGVELHGNVTRSYRAPSIVELYSPITNSFATVPFLCSPAKINAGPVQAVRVANCNAFLARYPTVTTQPALPALGGGNPGLRNEVADSFTYGILLKPRMLPGLRLSADYINIKVKSPISSLTVTQIAQGCFDNAEFNASDPANGNAFCSLIRRDASGMVIVDSANPAVRTGIVNGKLLRMDAIQLGAVYATMLQGIGIKGALSIEGTAHILRNRLNDVTGIAPVQSEGLLADPKFQALVRIAYANKAWRLVTRINYTGAQAAAYTHREAAPNDVREIDHFDPFATVDSALTLSAARQFSLTFTVTNLFNRIGQTYRGYIVPASINSPLGRRFTIAVDKRW